MPNPVAPPFYRKADINPMTQILADKATLAEFDGPPVVNLTDGTAAFGIIAVETAETFSWDFTSEEGWLLGVYIAFTGDNGAFRLDDINGVSSTEALVTGTTLILTTVPGSNSGETLDITISALAADDGVAKTGTLTFYDRYTTGPFTLSRAVKTLVMTKTYDAP